MKIGGFQKQSFIDWEGKITAVVFTKGCNFRCCYCHNPELVYPELIQQSEDIPEQIILDYLSSKTNWLDGVVITGGEPVLQSDLATFIRRVKKLGYPVKLDTNGSFPMVLQDLIVSGLVDYVAMDIKTVLELSEYQKICSVHDPELLKKIKCSVRILKESGVAYQLRTTVVPHIHTKAAIESLQECFSYCNYRLQEFREI